jgi:hypothetical protein
MQARAKLVEAFKSLRSNDAVPGSSSVYRITVRQLEALIRLSEALARVHHRTMVTVGDVLEAQRLIKASVHSAGDGDVVMELPTGLEEPEEFARELLRDDGAPAAPATADAEMSPIPGSCPLTSYCFSTCCPCFRTSCPCFGISCPCVGTSCPCFGTSCFKTSCPFANRSLL